MIAKNKKRGRPKKPKPGTYTLRPDDQEHKDLLKVQKLLNESSMTKTVYELARLYPQLKDLIQSQQETIEQLTAKETELYVLCSRIKSVMYYVTKNDEQR